MYTRRAVAVAATLACFSSPVAASGHAGDAGSWRRELDAFNGTYTIVNKADGRRIVASAEAGFSVVEGGLWPILPDQMWFFLPSDPSSPSAGRAEQSFSIVNAASGVRLFAKSGENWGHGFGAIDDGPVYQDQRWWFTSQSDGSYGIVNAKSRRWITSVAPAAGIAAVAATNVATPLVEEQRWWLINQQQDEAGQCLQYTGRQRKELDARGSQLASLASRLQHCETERQNAATRERDAERCEAGQLQQVQRDTARLASELEAERATRRVLSEQLLSGMPSRAAANVLSAAPTPPAHGEERRVPKALSPCLPTWLGCRPEVALAVVGSTLALVVLAGLYHWFKLRSVLWRRERRIQALEHEFREELSGMVRIGDEAAGELGFDFGFRILDREVGQETVRLIKIQCPGVEHADVEVELIFNGCIVALRRRASCGVEEATWRRRFQFRPSDGLFEFKEDQMSLERGYLQLFFRAYRFQSRVIRFPQHFSLADSDSDQFWDYPVYSDLDPRPLPDLLRPEAAPVAAVPGGGDAAATVAAVADSPAGGLPLAAGAAATAAAAVVAAGTVEASSPEKSGSHRADTESTASTAR